MFAKYFKLKKFVLKKFCVKRPIHAKKKWGKKNHAQKYFVSKQMLRPIKFVSLNKILGWKKIRVQRVSQKNWKSREILQHMTLFEWLTFNSSVKWLTIN